MTDQNSSMQAQSPLADAEDSIDSARRAVTEAQSHPTETSIRQAENAIEKAWRSISQAQGDKNSAAVEQAKELLNTARMDLDGTRESFH